MWRKEIGWRLRGKKGVEDYDRRRVGWVGGGGGGIGWRRGDVGDKHDKGTWYCKAEVH